MTFPLPRSSQEHYSKFFQTTIKKGILQGFIIQWVGCPLPCRFKSEQIKTIISPQHVFIMKSNTDDTFEYALIDNRGHAFKLPKKYYTMCFPSISLNSIPKDNRFEIQITKRKKMRLPFIPDSFLEQKKQKTNRKRRKMYHTVESPPTQTVESIDFTTTTVPSWHVLQNNSFSDKPVKKEIVQLIRSIITVTDNSAFTLQDPFEDVQSIQELKTKEQLQEKFKTIVSFLYHYARAELNIHPTSDGLLKIAEEFAANLNA
jgi:hypothetical protein